jgi:hypothetical protein
MFVKVGVSAGAVTTVDLEDNNTVADALTAAGLEVGDRDIKVNGVPAELATVVNADDYIQLTRKTKGAI